MPDEPSSQTEADARPRGSKPNPVTLWISGAVVILLAVATVVAFRSDDRRDSEIARRTDDTAVTPGLTAADGAVDVGDKVPDIRFDLMDGTETGFAELRGQPLVVNFFASYCTPCVTEMPDFESVHNRLGDRVRFIGIDVSEPIEAGQRIVDQTGVTYTIGRDPSGRIMRDLGGVAMPTTVFITADGQVAEIHSGQLSESGIELTIEEKLL